MEVEPNALSFEYSALHPVSFSLPHPAPQHPYTHPHANAAQPDLFTTSTLVLARPDRNVQAPLLDEVHIQNVSRVQVRSQHCTAGTNIVCRATLARCHCRSLVAAASQVHHSATYGSSVCHVHVHARCVQVQMYNAWREVETTAFAMQHVSVLTRGFVARVGSTWGSTGVPYAVTVPASKVRCCNRAPSCSTVLCVRCWCLTARFGDTAGHTKGSMCMQWGCR